MTILQFDDRPLCLCLTNSRLEASAKAIIPGVRDGVSVIMTHHRCRMGSGVCFIATKAPPWSRYSSAYSSSKIWRDRTKRVSTHSAGACCFRARVQLCMTRVNLVIIHQTNIVFIMVRTCSITFQVTSQCN